MEKKVYETPGVTKVEYDASDRITASSCMLPAAATEATPAMPGCRNV